MNEQPNIDAIVQLIKVPLPDPGRFDDQLARVITRSFDGTWFEVQMITGRSVGKTLRLETRWPWYEVQIP